MGKHHPKRTGKAYVGALLTLVAALVPSVPAPWQAVVTAGLGVAAYFGIYAAPGDSENTDGV